MRLGGRLARCRPGAAAAAGKAGCAGRSAGSRFRLRPDPAGSDADRTRPRPRHSHFDSNENARARNRLSGRPAGGAAMAKPGCCVLCRRTPIFPKPQSVARAGAGPRFRRQPWSLPRRRTRTIRRSGRCGCWKSRRKSASPSPPRRMAPPSLFPLAAGAFDVARAEGPERIAMEWWRTNGRQNACTPRLFPGGDQAMASVSGSIATGFMTPERSAPALVSARHFRMSYAELAVTTNFSFLRGASPSRRVRRAGGGPGLCRHRHRRPQFAWRAWCAPMTPGKSWTAERRPRLLVGARLVFRDGTPDILAYPRRPHSLWPAVPAYQPRQAARAQRRMFSGSGRPAGLSATACC